MKTTKKKQSQPFRVWAGDVCNWLCNEPAHVTPCDVPLLRWFGCPDWKNMVRRDCCAHLRPGVSMARCVQGKDDMTTFRGFAKTNEYKMRNMLSPAFKREVKRSSKRATADAYAAFCDFLAKHVPHEGATATYEEIDRNGYRVTHVTFTGKPSAFDLGTDGWCGVPVGGIWLLDDGPEGLTEIVRAGRQESTERYLARRVQGK